MARPGNPIGGIIVKGGKNPGGNLLVVTSTDNGEFELNGLEVGNYQFTLTAPDEPQDKGVGTQSAATAAAAHHPHRMHAQVAGPIQEDVKMTQQEKVSAKKGLKRNEAAERLSRQSHRRHRCKRR